MRTSSLLAHLLLSAFVAVPREFRAVPYLHAKQHCGEAELGTFSRLVKRVGKI